MLSAETAAGAWPEEAVAMMDRIATVIENDAEYQARVHFTETPPDPTTADALSSASAAIAKTVSAKAIVCFTMSGSAARRVARERPSVPLLVLTPKQVTARRLGLLWGAYAVHTREVKNFEDMVAKAKRMALRHNIAGAGDRIILLAGVPFGTPGSTNVLHVVRLIGDEIERHAASKSSAGQ
jgi:pyruvate kinase